METAAQQLTAGFYSWELRGRGWHVFDEPVDLEPGFVPFFFHKPKQHHGMDDGKRPTVISSLLESIKSLGRSQEQEPELPEEDIILAYAADIDDTFHYLRCSFPKGQKINQYETEQLIQLLSSCRYPVSFEVIATNEKIYVQYVCTGFDLSHIQNQLKVHFPAAAVTEQQDALLELPEGLFSIMELGLREEFMRPLAMPGSFDPDLLLSLFGVLDHIEQGKGATLQVLFKGCANPWAESILRSVSNSEGGSFFVDAPDMLPLAKQKISAPLYGVVVRVVGVAGTEDEADKIRWNMADSLVHLSRSSGNSILPLSNNEYPYGNHVEDVLYRQTHRLGMILNSKELSTFIHYPSVSVQSAKLERDARKTKPVPAIGTGQSFVIGINEHHGKTTTVSTSPEQRLKHTHIIGSTGSGKSTLLLNMIVQDIEAGNGCMLIDPHGDLVASILSYIPEKRIQDVLLIDPADSEYPVGFNILSAHSDIEKIILSSDLVAAFRKHSTSWGDQMNSVLANAILSFLESEQGGTLADLRRFLVEKSFRDKYLQTVTDPSIVYYWQHEYPILKNSSVGSIITRLDSFLRPKLIRNMVCQQKSLHFEQLMQEKKIILVKLSQGLIGTENSFLLGTFIVSKLHQAALARQAMPDSQRANFSLYIDEFQNFSTPSMASILTGVRKYYVGLVLAHQSMGQINDADVAGAVQSAGTRICFRVGETDAKKLEAGFSFFDAKDLQNLSTGEAIARIEKPEFDFSLGTIKREPSAIPAGIQEQILAYSRQTYATPKAEVETFIAQTLHIQAEEPPKRKPTVEIKKTQEGIPERTNKIEAVQHASSSQNPQPTILTRTATEDKPVSTDKKKESEHRYLQTLIKRMAEDRGYKVTIEEVTPDGKGKADIGLVRNSKRIACEISVTTTDTWEIHNVEKCVAAGYDVVIVCSTNKKQLEKIQKLVKEKLDSVAQAKVLMMQPEELFLYLDQEIANEAGNEERIKGFRVKVNYTAVSQGANTQKREQIIKTITESLRKKKKSSE
jgi:hypothetical protein